MYSGLLAAVIVSVLVVSVLIYKRYMLSKLFSLDIAGQVETFEKEIQKTAGVAVDKMSLAGDELAQLLEQAEETIEELKIRTKIAEEQLYKASINEVRANISYKNADVKTEAPAFSTDSFAQQLIRANYKTSLHLDEEYVREDKEVIVQKSAESIDYDLNFYGQNEQAEEQVAENFNVVEFPSIDMSDAEPKFRQKQIMRLAASGYDDMDIAKTLGLGIGEVRLTKKIAAK